MMQDTNYQNQEQDFQNLEDSNKRETLKKPNNRQDFKDSIKPQSPKVGVVIPIYNVAAYLRECLDSVCNQTYRNLEVLLVNDGSTDRSVAIAKEYVNKDSRFTLISKKNGGLSSARNVGIAYFSRNSDTGNKKSSFYQESLQTQKRKTRVLNNQDSLITSQNITEQNKDSINHDSLYIYEWGGGGTTHYSSK